MARKRLLWRLFPSYLIITLLSLLGVTWFAVRSLRSFHRHAMAADLEARAALVEQQVRAPFLGGDMASVAARCNELGRSSGTCVTVIRKDGQVVGDSDEDPDEMENHATDDRPEVMAAFDGERRSATRHSETRGKKMMYVAIPLKQGDDVVGVVRTALAVTSIEEALRGIRRELVVAGLVVAALAVGVSLFVSRWISRPLREMEAGARRFAQGDLEARLPVPETEELGNLAEAMNQMAAQLDDRLRTILRQRNEQEAILASMVEGVLAIDAQERVINMNQAAAEMVGLAQAAPRGRSIQEVVRNTALQQFVTAVLAGSGRAGEQTIRLDGGERIVQAHGVALRDARGDRIGALVVLNDVTRLRRLEAVRRDFVANVSHELKTPITSIKGFVETLLDGAIDDPTKAKRFLEIITTHTDRLNAIIDDLLNLSRIEQQKEKAEIALEKGRLVQVLTAAIAACAVKSEARDVSVDLSCDPELAATVNAPLLGQAVVNLVDNAIKYSEPGSHVLVEARRSDAEVAIAVRDHGCGIGEEHLPRIFERFYRVDKARSRKLGGTGLGLAIVKHIAQAHGGSVSVESAPGEGSTFTLDLPDR